MHKTAWFAGRGTVILVSLGAVLASTGCGSSDRLKKQVSQLESQVTAMRADQDRLEERLSALELSPPTPPRASASADDRLERPRLKVIHLEPEGEQRAEPGDVPEATAEPTGSRPIIRGTGDRIIKVGDDSGGGSTSFVAPPSRTVALARNSSGD